MEQSSRRLFKMSSLPTPTKDIPSHAPHYKLWPFSTDNTDLVYLTSINCQHRDSMAPDWLWKSHSPPFMQRWPAHRSYGQCFENSIPTVNFACFPASIKQLGVGMNIPDLECLLRIPKKTTHFRLYIATTCRTKRDAESTEAITQVVDRLLKHTHINQLFLSVPLIAVSDVLRLLRMAIHLGMTNLCLVVSKSSRAWKHNF